MTRSNHNINYPYGWYEKFLEKTRSYTRKQMKPNGNYWLPKRSIYPQGKILVATCPIRPGKCFDTMCQDLLIKRNEPKPGAEKKTMNRRNRFTLVDDYSTDVDD